ncbi:MAG: hypothetical protein H6765_09915 [Candidatus Peribacteria bacterium]|nr:MAG: hypothetical protein H6765_09915 [Candidatus Peribacteria bacterium]
MHTSTTWGSDTLLPYLALILTLSFVKQVFNYIFVSTDLQNKLLGINLFGVIVGASIGIPLILKYQLVGGIIAQGIFELLFVLGALWVAYKHNSLPHVARKNVLSIT